MEEIMKAFESKDDSFPINKYIERYPFNGCSKFLFEKFLILGYDKLTIIKGICKQENILSQSKDTQSIINSKMNYNPYANNNSFEIMIEPSPQGEISSDYSKNSITIDNILELVFPNGYIGYFYENDEQYKNAKELKEIPKPETMVFHSNPNTNEGDKKSQYGFAYIFHEKVERDKGKIYLLPKAFCIISEFPFYSSFNSLLTQIYYLFREAVSVPLELTLYNLIALTPSPINGNINLDIQAQIIKDGLDSSPNQGPKPIIKRDINLEGPIIFPKLTCIPVVDINLKNFLKYFPPQVFFKLFLCSFFEKDLFIFSTNLEMLSQTIFVLSTLNYPLNDGNYYWSNASVSYQNLVTGNSIFVGHSYTAMLGFHSPYSDSYLQYSDVKDHFVLDLDKKVIEYVVNNKVTEDVKPTQNILNLLKKVFKDRTSKYSPTLFPILKKLFSKIENEEKGYNHNSGYPKLYEKFEPEENKKIQEYFFTFILEVFTVLYKGISLHWEHDLSGTFDRNRNKEFVAFYNEYSKDIETKMSQEEKDFIFLVRSTFKFSSFIEGFVKTSNENGLYQIPFIFLDEFANLYSKEGATKKGEEEIKYFDVMESFYEDKKDEKENKKEEPLRRISDFGSQFDASRKTTCTSSVKNKGTERINSKLITGKTVNVDFLPIYKYFFKHLFKKMHRIMNSFENEKKDRVESDDDSPQTFIYKYPQIMLNQELLLRYSKILGDFSREDIRDTFPFYDYLEVNVPIEKNQNIIEALVEKAYIKQEKPDITYYLVYSVFMIFMITRSLCDKNELEEQSLQFSGILDSNLCLSRRYFKELLFVYEHLSNISQKEMENCITFYELMVVNKYRQKEVVINETLKQLINPLDNKSHEYAPNYTTNENYKVIVILKNNISKEGSLKENKIYEEAKARSYESGTFTISLKIIDDFFLMGRNTVNSSTGNEEKPQLSLIIKDKTQPNSEKGNIVSQIYTPKKIFDDLTFIKDKILYNINYPKHKFFKLENYIINLIFYIRNSPNEFDTNSIITMLEKILIMMNCLKNKKNNQNSQNNNSNNKSDANTP